MPIKSKISKYWFSPSALNLLFECPRCFWYAHHGIPRPRGIFPGLPGAIDKIIQGETKLWAGEGKPGWLLPEQEGIINAGPKKLVQQAEEYTLTGIVDDIVIQDGKLIIVDYKTARVPYTQEKAQKYYSLQIDCYALLCEGHYSQPVKTAYLVFFTPARIVRQKHYDEASYFQFDITHVEMPVNPENAREVLGEAVEMLGSEKPPAASQKCDYCRWVGERARG